VFSTDSELSTVESDEVVDDVLDSFERIWIGKFRRRGKICQKRSMSYGMCCLLVLVENRLYLNVSCYRFTVVPLVPYLDAITQLKDGKTILESVLLSIIQQ
jgi:hypothetical protein